MLGLHQMPHRLSVSTFDTSRPAIVASSVAREPAQCAEPEPAVWQSLGALRVRWRQFDAGLEQAAAGAEGRSPR